MHSKCSVHVSYDYRQWFQKCFQCHPPLLPVTSTPQTEIVTFLCKTTKNSSKKRTLLPQRLQLALAADLLSMFPDVEW